MKETASLRPALKTFLNQLLILRGRHTISVASGNARMAVEDALTEQDKAESYILASEAKIHGDVTVDA